MCIFVLMPFSTRDIASSQWKLVTMVTQPFKMTAMRDAWSNVWSVLRIFCLFCILQKKNYGSSVLRCVFKLSLLRITRNCELVSNWLLHTGRHIFQPLVCKCIWVQSALARTADGRWESMMMDNKQRERLCAHHRIKIYTSPLEWNGTFFITTTSISVHIYLMQKLQNTNMIYMP